VAANFSPKNLLNKQKIFDFRLAANSYTEFDHVKPHFGGFQKLFPRAMPRMAPEL
jgi:hypothetical protein